MTTCDGCTNGDFNNIVVTNGSGSDVAFEDSFSTANFTATTADTSLTFEASTTVTITGNLNLNGGAVGNEVIIDSSDGSTRFTFDVTGGDQTVSYINVSNSQASSNNITANDSIQGANTDAAEGTPHWIFGGGGGGPLKGAIIIVD